MPRYIIERTVPRLTPEELTAAGRRSNAALAGMPDAPSIEAIREHARLAGLPADRISEIALEIHPGMFV